MVMFVIIPAAATHGNGVDGVRTSSNGGCQMPSSSATKWRRRRCGGVYSTVLQLLDGVARASRWRESAQWCYQPEGAGEGRRRGDQGGHGIDAGVARAPLDEAERSWDKFVAELGMKVRGYPQR